MVVLHLGAPHRLCADSLRGGAYHTTCGFKSRVPSPALLARTVHPLRKGHTLRTFCWEPLLPWTARERQSCTTGWERPTTKTVLLVRCRCPLWRSGEGSLRSARSSIAGALRLFRVLPVCLSCGRMQPASVFVRKGRIAPPAHGRSRYELIRAS